MKNKPITRIVVVGYGEMFANLIMGCLESGNEVVGVLRHSKVLYNPLILFFKDIFSLDKDKSFINSYNLYEIKANSVNDAKFHNEILKLNPDIILVGSWSEKLIQKTINLPKIACINCHPSLLPKYRGPNPYAQVIKNGEAKTGITFHLMDKNYDAGAILQQAEVNILPDDTGETLKLRCCNAAKNEVIKLLNTLENEIIIPITQNEHEATYQKQVSADDIIIDFNKTSIEIDRHLRAIKPWNKCYFPYKSKFFAIDKYKIIENEHNIRTPATIVKKNKRSIQITCIDNKIIEFSNLKMLDSLFNLETEFYIRYFVKTGDKIK